MATHAQTLLLFLILLLVSIQFVNHYSLFWGSGPHDSALEVHADSFTSLFRVIPSGVVFVGHTNTDTDSIACAIAGAHLYDGIAARASELNSETTFVLKRLNLAVPPPVENIVGERSVCLVDVNQKTQLPKGVREDKIVCIIDHHALQSQTIVTDVPLQVDILPLGSGSTVLFFKWLEFMRLSPKNHPHMSSTIAELLLAGILSDTLGLKSPTTTSHDKIAAQALATHAGVKDIAAMTRDMLEAKSDLSKYSLDELIRLDYKQFKLETKEKTSISLGFGVVETVKPNDILSRLPDVLKALEKLKSDNKQKFVFFAVVDTLQQKSTLLCLGESEMALAEAVYGGKGADHQLDLGNRVSRKKEFMPVLSQHFRSKSDQEL